MKAVLAAAVVLHGASGLSEGDLTRAKTPRPAAGSHVQGATPSEAFAKMNAVLRGGRARTRRCEEWSHEGLNAVASTLYARRTPQLEEIYAGRKDKRALHFGSLAYKTALWEREAAAATAHPAAGPGTALWNATRDGKCAEAVMWWTHHLSDSTRETLSAQPDFVLPEMPKEVAPKGIGSHEYVRQISCVDCHVPVHIPGTPLTPPVSPPRNYSGPQFRETCPAGDNGKPVVWYDRTKRCDWDYEPFCQPCEGRGGLLWGNGEGEYNPMQCEVVATPEQVPEANRTSPLWPKDFTVDEYAMLTFPAGVCDRDCPCNGIKFKNSTYTLRFATTPEGPVYHTTGHTGPSGPSPLPGSSWGLPNGNFYTTVDILGGHVFCLCIGTTCPTGGCANNTIVGPLRYNFNDHALFIGREKIVPEYLNKEVVTDHWVSGPHHFWMDVATGLMVREWQPFNGMNIYYNWRIGAPDVSVPKLCYTGLLHHNISCPAPAPAH
eukprot:Hpha_TRINITY_DN16944_c1_g1::TRINITY_DN16944_c1_g1_i4::g.54036::m.54036